MPQTGSLVVRTFTSQAQLPVSGATVIISSSEKDGRRKGVLHPDHRRERRHQTL